MFAMLDKNGDGKITFEEWHDYLVHSGLGKEKCASLEALFQQLDKDGSGSIDRAEFEALIKLCVHGREPTAEQVESLWKASNEIEDDDPDDPDQANAIMFADAFCMACHQQGCYPSPSDRVKRAEG